MGFPEVTQDAVYLCTGNPLPSDIDKMLVALNNKTFKEAYDCEQSARLLACFTCALRRLLIPGSMSLLQSLPRCK